MEAIFHNVVTIVSAETGRYGDRHRENRVDRAAESPRRFPNSCTKRDLDIQSEAHWWVTALSMRRGVPGCIVVCQPRRVAATSTARRVAAEMSTDVRPIRGGPGLSNATDWWPRWIPCAVRPPGRPYDSYQVRDRRYSPAGAAGMLTPGEPQFVC